MTATTVSGVPPGLSTGGFEGARYIALARILTGYMWFTQTLWKLPWEDYGGPGGLLFWIERTSREPKFGWYKAFVDGVVLPHFSFFAFQLWLIETVIAVTLILGLFGRLGGLLGGLMGLNLLIANSGFEWYWNYVFLALLNFTFFFTRAGRSIGVDQFLAPKIERAAAQGKTSARIIRFFL